MRLSIMLLCALTTYALMMPHSVVSAEIDSGSGSMAPIKIKSDGGLIDAELQLARFPHTFRDGSGGALNVFTVYEPKSKLLWWDYSTSQLRSKKDFLGDFKRDHAIYFTGGKLVVFSTDEPGDITVCESTETRHSFAEGISDILDTAHKELARSRPPTRKRGIGLIQKIDPNFMCGGLYAVCLPGSVKIADLEHTSSQWTITLENSQKQHAKVTVDPGYKVQTITVNGKVVFPRTRK